ncbi:gas vesicle protein GvpJ [Nonomuraea sp. NPDC049152]|uniref:gas vesicle protein n=1 Tax=Nonomuraea sp. NPDC049152 TaxID=3154350 RepID=UPI0033F07F09
MTEASRFTPAVRPGSSVASAGRESANLGDILERVLDRGVVIAGDIRVNLLDIELLTIKLRLVIASVDTAREMGIDWWEHDPWLTGNNRGLLEENRRLRARLTAMEEQQALVLEEEQALESDRPDDHRE